MAFRVQASTQAGGGRWVGRRGRGERKRWGPVWPALVLVPVRSPAQPAVVGLHRLFRPVKEAIFVVVLPHLAVVLGGGQRRRYELSGAVKAAADGVPVARITATGPRLDVVPVHVL